MELVRSLNFPGSATLNPGPVCNLACTTCDSPFSTRWQAIKNEHPTKLDRTISVESLDFAGLNHVIICGGEPLLHKSTWAAVEYLGNLNIQTSVHFNGTVRPDENFLNLCAAHSNEVRFIFSIDGIGKRFDYLRWPGKWEDVVENLNWINRNATENVSFSVNKTISILNVNSHNEVDAWLHGQFVNRNLNITQQDAGGYLSPVKLNYYDRLDLQRNTNWREIFPEVAQKYPRESYIKL